jgi:hypothetical protein
MLDCMSSNPPKTGGNRMSSFIAKSLGCAALALTSSAVVPGRAQTAGTPVDATLYTTYSLYGQNVGWTVCGSTQETEGCYSSGELGPFVKVGALLEGDPLTKGDTVSRAIYVLDTGGASVLLYVYKKQDTVTSETDTVSVTLIKAVTLPLTGGSNASCSMAANKGFLFIGTNQSPQAVEVKKSDLSVAEIGGFSPPINVSAITADSYGYVTVTFGGVNVGESGFYVYGPSGESEEDGGGATFMLGTQVAVLGSGLPTNDSKPAQRVGYSPR